MSSSIPQKQTDGLEPKVQQQGSSVTAPGTTIKNVGSPNISGASQNSAPPHNATGQNPVPAANHAAVRAATASSVASQPAPSSVAPPSTNNNNQNRLKSYNQTLQPPRAVNHSFGTTYPSSQPTQAGGRNTTGNKMPSNSAPAQTGATTVQPTTQVVNSYGAPVVQQNPSAKPVAATAPAAAVQYPYPYYPQAATTDATGNTGNAEAASYPYPYATGAYYYPYPYYAYPAPQGTVHPHYPYPPQQQGQYDTANAQPTNGMSSQPGPSLRTVATATSGKPSGRVAAANFRATTQGPTRPGTSQPAQLPYTTTTNNPNARGNPSGTQHAQGRGRSIPAQAKTNGLRGQVLFSNHEKASIQPSNDTILDMSIGHLARKFCNLIQASTTDTIDLNEASIQLQVPKRQILDVTQVLKGVGLVEEHAKDIIVWRGSPGGTSTDSPIDPVLEGDEDQAARESVERVRAKVDHYYREEAILDSWISNLKSQLERQKQRAAQNFIATNAGQRKGNLMPLGFVLSEDIIESLYYPKQPSNVPVDAITWAPKAVSTNSKSSILAIHAPADSTVNVMGASATEDTPKYRLVIAQKTDLQKINTEAKQDLNEGGAASPRSSDTKRRFDNTPDQQSPEKRVRITPSPGGDKERSDAPIQVYLLPVKYDAEAKKVVSNGAKLLPTKIKDLKPGDEGTNRKEPQPLPKNSEEKDWNFTTPTLEDSEGAANFF